MSTPLSPSSSDPATTTIPPPPTLKSAVDVVPSTSSQSRTQVTVEKIVGSSDEQRNEQGAREGTQDQRLSSYTGDEKNKIKEELSQHFEADDIQEFCTTSGTVVNDQGKRPSPSLDYTWKSEEARRRREQAKIRNGKMARVTQQAHSTLSPTACNGSPNFVLFQGQQRGFCTECLTVIGMMQISNVRVCPTCKRSFVSEQCRLPL